MSNNIPVKQIFQIKEIGQAYNINSELPVTSKTIFDLASYIAKSELDKIKYSGVQINSPESAVECVRNIIGQSPDEIFYVIYLNNKHKIIDHEYLFRGSLDSAMIYPRNLLRRILEVNASAIFVFHNHPGGSISPSCADDLITTKLKRILDNMDCVLLFIQNSLFSYNVHKREKGIAWHRPTQWELIPIGM